MRVNTPGELAASPSTPWPGPIKIAAPCEVPPTRTRSSPTSRWRRPTTLRPSGCGPRRFRPARGPKTAASCSRRSPSPARGGEFPHPDRPMRSWSPTASSATTRSTCRTTGFRDGECNGIELHALEPAFDGIEIEFIKARTPARPTSADADKDCNEGRKGRRLAGPRGQLQGSSTPVRKTATATASAMPARTSTATTSSTSATTARPSPTRLSAVGLRRQQAHADCFFRPAPSVVRSRLLGHHLGGRARPRWRGGRRGPSAAAAARPVSQPAGWQDEP